MSLARAGALAAVLAGAALCVACRVEKHYKLLSFFFDGVPPPGAAGAPGRAGAGESAVFSSHPGYVERRCNECHGDQARFGLFASGFTKLDDSVCTKCHAQVLDEHPMLHGPVAAGACLWCHQPHESPQPWLLTAASPALCLQCHRFQLQEAPPVAHHQDPDRDCLECHAGHGGAHRYFLREIEVTP